MKRTTFHKAIRFRRWARKAYAVFRSLGCCVTIGRLNPKVANASLKKQKTGIPANPPKTDKKIPCDDEPDDGLLYDLLLLELTGQFPLAGETCQPEYDFIDIKPNNYSRKDTHAISPVYLF